MVVKYNCYRFHVVDVGEGVLCSVYKNLKEQCHEDFAVLGQFCAEIITFRLKIINKMLL